ncbi:MAG TPA: hypothetical protein VK961_10025 [Chthoniobacter sp.]|nr:hypothetical protein [Chthoniobacter sp.]
MQPPSVAPASSLAIDQPLLTRTEASPALTKSTAALWPSVLFALAVTSITAGIIWDISWHISIGRDTFWTPAHMAIYLGGMLSGMTGGWLAFYHTFLARPEERNQSVGIFGARAPLGAWVSMWGAVAMLTSAPFDDWWHNAYGLDVRIISPPHTLLGIGMLGISVGALLVGLSHQNRTHTRAGDWLFIYIGGVFITLGSVFLMEVSFPNLQHTGTFYEVCAAVFVFRFVTLGVAGRITWPATRAAAVFIAIQCLATWILPLFSAHPKLAPIFNPVTHMVPPAFPVLMIFPALAMDLIIAKMGPTYDGWKGLLVATLLSAAFLAVFIPVQWNFARFLLTPLADNWFFAGNRYWGYETHVGPWADKFFHVDPHMPNYDPFTARTIGLSWIAGTISAWLGLAWGGWMRKVQR